MTKIPLKIDTAVVILNWNGLKHLEDCFQSVTQQTYQQYRVILVDNGSTDGSVEYTRKNFPAVEVIETGANLGFAEGNNVGFRKVLQDPAIKYVVALNNDTEVEQTWLEELVAIARNDDRVGAVASKMKMFNQRDMIDSAGDFLLANSFKVVTRGYREIDTGQYNTIEECFTARAAAALYRREMLDQVMLGDDYFDSHYFAYIEDTDLSIRARLAGWKIMYAPNSVVYHKVSATTKTLPSMFLRYHSGRNRVFTAIKNLPISMWRAALAEQGSVDGPQNQSMGLQVWIYTKIFFSVVIAFPRLLSQRRRIQAIQSVTSSEIGDWQSRFSVQ